jgi:hypothetical protein
LFRIAAAARTPVCYRFTGGMSTPPPHHYPHWRRPRILRSVVIVLLILAATVFLCVAGLLLAYRNG